LRIGQSGKQFVELSGSIMEDAILQGANPQIAVAAGDSGNMRSREARVEGREPAAVEYQEALRSVPSRIRPDPNTNTDVTIRRRESAGRIWRKRAPLKANSPSPRVAMKSSGSADPAAIPTDMEPSSAGGNSMPTRYERISAPFRLVQEESRRARSPRSFLYRPRDRGSRGLAAMGSTPAGTTRSTGITRNGNSDCARIPAAASSLACEACQNAHPIASGGMLIMMARIPRHRRDRNGTRNISMSNRIFGITALRQSTGISHTMN
jgi:hypothetical protein